MQLKINLSICILLFGAIVGWAQCPAAYNRAVGNFQNGKYVEARQNFQWCQLYCTYDLDQNEIQRYISLCEQKIEASKKALAEKRKKIQEQEEQSRKQVENNRLIYFSCDAAIFDNVYARFGSEITMALTKQGYKFTRDKEKALWIITITAIARKDLNFNNENYRFATVDAVGTIYNTIDDSEYPFTESHRFGSETYDLAAEMVFRRGELLKDIIQDIILILQM